MPKIDVVRLMFRRHEEKLDAIEELYTWELKQNRYGLQAYTKRTDF